MAKNFYQLLEASEHASKETIDVLFAKQKDRLFILSQSGDPAVKGQLWALKQAYDVLSNPEKRAAYDAALKPEPFVSKPAYLRQTAADYDEQPIWRSNYFLLGLAGFFLVGMWLIFGRTTSKETSAIKMTEVVKASDNEAARVNNDAMRVQNERILAEGTVKNTRAVIDTQGQVANRIVGVAETAEMRRSRELEYRANAGTEILRQQEESNREILRQRNEELNWQRQQYEQQRAVEQSRARVEADRFATIQLMLEQYRFGEARAFAISSQERQMVSDAERSARGVGRRY